MQGYGSVLGVGDFAFSWPGQGAGREKWQQEKLAVAMAVLKHGPASNLSWGVPAQGSEELPATALTALPLYPGIVVTVAL